MKRILSIVLVVIFVFSIIPIASVDAISAGVGSREIEGGMRDFKWPVPSSFGLSSCFEDDGRNHDAIDIAGAARGADVVASYDGTVYETGYANGYGNYVLIEHNYKLQSGERMKLYSKYNHLNSINVSKGQNVYRGTTVVGGVGDSGGDYPVHLDYQILTSPNWGNYNYHNVSIDPYINDLLELPSGIYCASTPSCCGVGPTACCCYLYIQVVKAQYAIPICEHSYKGEGVCSKCGYVFPWQDTKDTSYAGTYAVTLSGGTYPRPSAPYSDSAKSSTLFPKGAKISVSYGVTNAYNNIWYYATYGGVSGFVNEDNVQLESRPTQQFTCLISSPAEGAVVPKSAYPVIGTLTSAYYPIKEVKAYIDGSCYATVSNVNATSLELRPTAINQKLDFAGLSSGKHVLRIDARDSQSSSFVTVINRTFYTETQSAPTNAKVVTNKSTYTLGEVVTITPTASGASGYNVSVWLGAFGSGEQVYGNYDEFTGSVSFKPSKAGSYTVRASCINSAGYVDTECTFTVKNPHTHQYTSKVTKAATCTATGVKTYTCSCGASYTESIPATGHVYGNALYESAHPHYKYYKCSSCGEISKDTSSTTALSSCDACDEPNPVHIEPGIYTIQSARDNNYVLDIQNDSTENLANIQLYQNLNNTVQKFRIVEYGDYYLIQSVWSGLWLDIASPVRASGSNVRLYNSYQYHEEKWYFEDAGNGYVYIRNYYGTYIDIAGDTATNNANIQVYDTKESNSQRWKLVPYTVDVDLNAYIDGQVVGNTKGYGTADVYINGTLVADDVTDYCTQWPVGTTYEFKDIKPVPGYSYNGVTQGQRSGVVGEDRVYIALNFSKIDNSTVTEVGEEHISNGRSYVYFSTPLTWYAANEYCQSLGGHLVTISDAAEENFVRSMFASGKYVWIGATDQNSEGTWTWVTGEPFNYTYWEDEQPDNYANPSNDGEDFVHYGIDGKWNDIHGDATYGFICEFSGCSHSYRNDVIAPTCTSSGYTSYTCVYCSDSYKGNFTDALGHSYSYKVASEPTTTKAGNLTGTCGRCRGTTTVTLPVLSTKDYTYEAIKTATCTSTGTGRYTWKDTVYGKFYFDVTIAKTAHSYSATTIVPTCTEQGYTVHTCSCGDSYKDNYVDAKGHTYSNGSCTNCAVADPSTGNFQNPFEDVKEKDYFYTPVLWAVQKGITNGTSATKFSPEAPCTRGQIVTFLWRACGSPEPNMAVNPFTDVSKSAYYYKAVLWALENGITTGTGKDKFSPEDTCTRGQVATFLWRAQGKPAPTSSDNPFNDVNSSAYYYNAILWAVEKGVTNGTGKGRFSPDDSCTRGQIVTFLYRALS